MGRNTTKELLSWYPVFCLVLIFFTFKLTQTYIYKRTKLTQSSCTFAYNLKVKIPKHGTIVNSPRRGYASVKASLFPYHVPTSVSRKPQLYHVWYRHIRTTYTYPHSGTFFFLYHLKETTYMVHPLVPTTNVPDGPIQTIGHL